MLKFVKSLRGLPLKEFGEKLQQFGEGLTEEFREYTDLAAEPRNQALVKTIASHKQQLMGTNQNLVVIAGWHHLRPEENTGLNQVLTADEPATIFTVKNP